MSHGPSVVTKALRDSFLKDESGLCDGYLHTSDDFIVAVPRAILASRFIFFKRLFYSEYKKSSYRKPIEIDATAKDLEYIIDFALTDDCDLLVKGKSNVSMYSREDETTDNLRPLMADVISLMTTAQRLEISPLKRRCKLLVTSFIKTIPSTCCTVLDEVSILRFLDTSSEKHIFKTLSKLVLNRIMKNPTETLLMSPDHGTGIVDDSRDDDSDLGFCTVVDLRPEAIAMIIDQQKLSPQQAFEMLYYWTTKGVKVTEDPKYIEPESFPSRQRWEEGSELVKRIPLACAPNAFLTKCVGPTKLVANEHMAELYRWKLLKIEEKKEARKDRKRRLSSIKRECSAEKPQDTLSSSESEDESTDSESDFSESSKDIESMVSSSSDGESSETSSEDEGRESSSGGEGSETSSDGEDSESSSDGEDSESSSDGEGSESLSDIESSEFSSESENSESSRNIESSVSLSEGESSQPEAPSDRDSVSSSGSDSNSGDEESDSDGTNREVELESQYRASRRQRLHRE